MWGGLRRRAAEPGGRPAVFDRRSPRLTAARRLAGLPPCAQTACARRSARSRSTRGSWSSSCAARRWRSSTRAPRLWPWCGATCKEGGGGGAAAHLGEGRRKAPALPAPAGALSHDSRQACTSHAHTHTHTWLGLNKWAHCQYRDGRPCARPAPPHPPHTPPHPTPHLPASFSLLPTTSPPPLGPSTSCSTWSTSRTACLAPRPSRPSPRPSTV